MQFANYPAIIAPGILNPTYCVFRLVCFGIFFELNFDIVQLILQKPVNTKE